MHRNQLARVIVTATDVYHAPLGAEELSQRISELRRNATDYTDTVVSADLVRQRANGKHYYGPRKVHEVNQQTAPA